MKKRTLLFAGALLLAAITLIGMVSTDIAGLLPGRPIGFVRKYKPGVFIRQNDKRVSVSKAEKLISGDTLSTNDHGFALVQFIDKSIAKIKPNSQLILQGQINGKNQSSTRINVESGELFLQVTKRSTTNFEVATNSSVAAVKGTQFGAREDNYFWVIEGVVEVRSKKSGKTVSLTKRMYGKVKTDGTITTGELTDEEIEKLQHGYNTFDEQLKPNLLKLRYQDDKGQIKTLALKYFKNQQ